MPKLTVFDPVPSDGRRLYQMLSDAAQAVKELQTRISADIKICTSPELGLAKVDLCEHRDMTRALKESLQRASRVVMKFDPYVCELCGHDGDSISPHKPGCPRCE